RPGPPRRSAARRAARRAVPFPYWSGGAIRVIPVSHRVTGAQLPPLNTPAAGAADSGSEYAALSRQVKQAGLLKRRRTWYAWRIGGTAPALGAGGGVFGLTGDSWWQS